MTKRADSFYARLQQWLGMGRDGMEDATSTATSFVGGQIPSKYRLPESIEDRYQLIRTLGKGAFGIVFLARDQAIGRMIAIKLLYRHYHRTEDIYKRFMQEARIAGQLEHPNIVTIYDVADDKRSACIIMEYLGGGSLGRRLELEGPMDQETALVYLRGIMSGLAAAHEKGVVHRDIKPRNILFDQTGRTKISDFGIAHLPVEHGGLDVDGDLTTLGTPSYMAPEQMVPGRRIDPRADLFAGGLLLYEMLTGKQRFDFGTEMGLRRMHETVVGQAVGRREDLPPGISEPVVELLQRLAQPAPQDRYGNAGEVITAIDRALRRLRGQPMGGSKAINGAAETAQGCLEMYEDILRLFLVDGVISSPERRELDKRAKRLGISTRQAQEAEERVRADLKLPLLAHLREYELQAEKLLKDGEYGEEDLQVLRELGQRYGISLPEQRKIEEVVLLRHRVRQPTGTVAIGQNTGVGQ